MCIAAASGILAPLSAPAYLTAMDRILTVEAAQTLQDDSYRERELLVLRGITTRAAAGWQPRCRVFGRSRGPRLSWGCRHLRRLRRPARAQDYIGGRWRRFFVLP
jgi:hypothetical protein